MPKLGEEEYLVIRVSDNKKIMKFYESEPIARYLDSILVYEKSGGVSFGNYNPATHNLKSNTIKQGA